MTNHKTFCCFAENKVCSLFIHINCHLKRMECKAGIFFLNFNYHTVSLLKIRLLANKLRVYDGTMCIDEIILCYVELKKTIRKISYNEPAECCIILWLTIYMYIVLIVQFLVTISYNLHSLKQWIYIYYKHFAPCSHWLSALVLVGAALRSKMFSKPFTYQLTLRTFHEIHTTGFSGQLAF
jgi:hypothetical protein